MSCVWNHDSFVERLQQCAGSPWTVFEAQQQLDALVVSPLPLAAADACSGDPHDFVDFLATTFHRRLLWCFVGSKVARVWTLEELMKQVRPPSIQALHDALERCVSWQMALVEREAGRWWGHPRLAVIPNLGWTFEWLVQVLLERDYGAQVRRHVVLGEIAPLGEIDVLALLDSGQSLLVECKSSSQGVTDRHIDRFLAKGRGFPASRALLLLESDDPHQMQQRMGQLGQAMFRAYGEAWVGVIHTYGGSQVVCLRDHLYVADTGGGIVTTLQAVLAGPLS